MLSSTPGRKALIIVSSLASLSALAQTAPPPNSTPTEEEIEKAINADASANAQSRPQAVPAPPAPSLPSATAPSATASSAGFRFFQSLNPDLSFIADFAGAWFSQPMEMTGDHDPKDNGFNFQALEMAVGAAVDPYFRFDANIVLKHPEGVEIEEAYGTTLTLPAGFQVRAGKFLTRFGRFNPTHPHTWTFSDQPLVEGRFFGPDGNRGVGVEVSELLTFMPWYVEVLVAANDTRGEGDSFLALTSKISSPLDLQYMGTINQFWPLTDDLSLAWGVSGMTGSNTTGQRTNIWGSDLYLKYRPLTEGSFTIISLAAEFMQRRYDTPQGIVVDSGAFAHLFWRFAQRWGAGLSAEYASNAEYDPLGIAGTQQRYKADMTFWPTEFSRLRLQYDLEPPGSNHPTNTAQAVFLALELAVGAHGAHKF